MHQAPSQYGIDRDVSELEDRTAPIQSPIHLEPFELSVDAVVNALEEHPAWDRHTTRQEQYAHAQMSDVWVRFNAWENYRGDLATFNDLHESVWYPVANEIPALRLLINDLLYYTGADRELGGVLITKIPPGGSISPHVDQGWHAEYYEDKYAIQLKGNEEQSFNFEGVQLSTQPGQVIWFDNSQLHWVDNESDEDRITMIVCTREKT